MDTSVWSFNLVVLIPFLLHQPKYPLYCQGIRRLLRCIIRRRTTSRPLRIICRLRPHRRRQPKPSRRCSVCVALYRESKGAVCQHAECEPDL